MAVRPSFSSHWGETGVLNLGHRLQNLKEAKRKDFLDELGERQSDL